MCVFTREIGAMYCEAPRIRRVREGRGILLQRMIYLRARFRGADAEPVTCYSLKYVSGKFLSRSRNATASSAAMPRFRDIEWLGKLGAALAASNCSALPRNQF